MTDSVELKERPDEAGNGGHGGDGRDKTFEIAIIYNGDEKKVEVDRDETISSVLAKAIAVFAITSNQHTLALYNADGNELHDNQTVKSAKVKKHDRLLLRPSAVKAG